MKETKSKNNRLMSLFLIGVLLFGIFANVFFENKVWAGDGPYNSKNIAVIEFPLSLNDATAEEMSLIPGIGSGLAERIIKYREEAGEFRTKCELRKISGIGPRMYEKIKDKIYVSGDLTPDLSNPDELNNSGESENPRIDINLADVNQFKKIKGLGEKIGIKIIEYRQKNGNRIQKIDELTSIGGIGTKRIQTLKKYFIAY